MGLPPGPRPCMPRALPRPEPRYPRPAPVEPSPEHLARLEAAGWLIRTDDRLAWHWALPVPEHAEREPWLLACAEVARLDPNDPLPRLIEAARTAP